MKLKELIFVAIGVTIIQGVFGFIAHLNPATEKFWQLVRH